MNRRTTSRLKFLALAALFAAATAVVVTGIYAAVCEPAATATAQGLLYTLPLLALMAALSVVGCVACIWSAR